MTNTRFKPLESLFDMCGAHMRTLGFNLIEGSCSRATDVGTWKRKEDHTNITCYVNNTGNETGTIELTYCDHKLKAVVVPLDQENACRLLAGVTNSQLMAGLDDIPFPSLC